MQKVTQINRRRGLLGALVGLLGISAALKTEASVDLPAAPEPIMPLDEAAIKAGWTRCEGTVGVGATRNEMPFFFYSQVTKHP